MKNVLLILLVFLFTSCEQYSLPDQPLAEQWQLINQSQWSTWLAIEGELGARAIFFAEYGLNKVEQYEYQHPQSEVEVKVRLYNFDKQDDAFGLFSFLKPVNMKDYKIGDDSFLLGTVLFIKANKVVLRLEPSKGGIALDNLIELGQALVNNMPKSLPPQLVREVFQSNNTNDTKIVYGHTKDIAKIFIDATIVKKLALTIATEFVFLAKVGLEQDAGKLFVKYPSESLASKIVKNLSHQNIEDLQRMDATIQFCIKNKKTFNKP